MSELSGDWSASEIAFLFMGNVSADVKLAYWDHIYCPCVSHVTSMPCISPCNVYLGIHASMMWCKSNRREEARTQQYVGHLFWNWKPDIISHPVALFSGTEYGHRKQAIDSLAENLSFFFFSPNFLFTWFCMNLCLCRKLRPATTEFHKINLPSLKRWAVYHHKADTDVTTGLVYHNDHTTSTEWPPHWLHDFYVWRSEKNAGFSGCSVCECICNFVHLTSIVFGLERLPPGKTLQKGTVGPLWKVW